MNQKIKKIIISLLLSIGLSIIFGKFVGNMIYSWLKPISGLGPQPQCPECFDGFILSYLFFISLLINLFSFDKKNQYWLMLLLPILLYINPPFEFFIIGAGLIMLGWLLSRAIIILNKKRSS